MNDSILNYQEIGRRVTVRRLWDRGTVLLSHMSHKLRIENGELRIVDEILTDFHD